MNNSQNSSNQKAIFSYECSEGYLYLKSDQIENPNYHFYSMCL